MVQIMRMKIPMHNAEGLVRESKFRAIAEANRL